MVENSTTVLSSSSVVWKCNTDFNGLRARHRQGLYSGVSRGESVYLSFAVLETVGILCLVAFFLHLQSQQRQIEFCSHHISWTLLSLHFSLTTAHGSSLLWRMHLIRSGPLENPEKSFQLKVFSKHLITSSKSLSPRKVTYLVFGH